MKNKNALGHHVLKEGKSVLVLCMKWYLVWYANKAVFEGKIKLCGQYKIPGEQEQKLASCYSDKGNEH